MKVLSFFSRNFGLLKRVPPFPLALDGALLLWTFLTRSEVLDWLDYIRDEVEKWPDISITMHRFGGLEFRKGGKEIGHIHSNGVLDLPLPKAIREEVLRTGTAVPHHTFPLGNMVSLVLRKSADRETARTLNLLKLSCDAREKI